MSFSQSVNENRLHEEMDLCKDNRFGSPQFDLGRGGVSNSDDGKKSRGV